MEPPLRHHVVSKRIPTAPSAWDIRGCRRTFGGVAECNVQFCQPWVPCLYDQRGMHCMVQTCPRYVFQSRHRPFATHVHHLDWLGTSTEIFVGKTRRVHETVPVHGCHQWHDTSGGGWAVPQHSCHSSSDPTTFECIAPPVVVAFLVVQYIAVFVFSHAFGVVRDDSQQHGTNVCAFCQQ